MTLHPLREMIGWGGNRAPRPASGRQVEPALSKTCPRAALAFILAMFAGCAAKPVTLPVIAKCGPMPAAPVDCVATLPPSASDADLVRCWAESRAAWQLDAMALRVQYQPCSGAK